MPRSIHIVAFLLLAAGVAGCAALAKPTPTPAAKIPPGGLDQPPKPPQERYYAMVFGCQWLPYVEPRRTHTFAMVVKATWQPGCDQPTLEPATISWMPDDYKIEFYPFKIKPGQNLTVQQTLKWALGDHQSVAMWGPYELRTSTYRRFLIQKEFLESGQIGYQLIDDAGESARTGLGCDCIHAITDMDPAFDRARYPLIFYGQIASRRLVHEAARRQAFIDPWTEHDWLIPALGLDQYPIERKPQPYKGIRPQLNPNRAARRPLMRRDAD